MSPTPRCFLWNILKKDVHIPSQSIPLECFFHSMYHSASLVAQMVKNPPAMRETWVWSLGWEDSLEKVMATHPSTLACRIPRTIVHGVAKSWTRLSKFHFLLMYHCLELLFFFLPLIYLFSFLLFVCLSFTNLPLSPPPTPSLSAYRE